MKKIKFYSGIFCLFLAASFYFSSAQENILPVSTEEERMSAVEVQQNGPSLKTDYYKSDVVQGEGSIDFSFPIINNGKTEESYGVILIINKSEDNSLNFVDQILATTTILKVGENKINYKYSMPSFLSSGNYFASLRIMNSAGMPVIQFLPLKDFVLNVAENKIKPLDGRFCSLAIDKDQAKKVYGLLDGPDLSKQEELMLNCDTSSTTLSGVYEKYIAVTNRSYGVENLEFKKAEDVSVENNKFSFVVNNFQNQKPQAYDYVFYLAKDGKRVTPVMQAHYVLQGESATVHDINYFYSKDKVNIETSITGASTNFPDSRAGVTIQNNKVKVTLLDANGKDLQSKEKNIQVSNEPLFKIIQEFKIEDMKSVSKIKVEIFSSEGYLLSEKIVNFVYNDSYILAAQDYSTQKDNLNNNENATNFSELLNIKNMSIVLIIILILILIIYFIIKNRNNKAGIVASLSLFITLGYGLTQNLDAYKALAQSAPSIIFGSGESRNLSSGYYTGYFTTYQTSKVEAYGPYLFLNVSGNAFTTWCGNWEGNSYYYANLDIRQKLNGIRLGGIQKINNSDRKNFSSYWGSNTLTAVYASDLNIGSNIMDFDFKYYPRGSEPYPAEVSNVPIFGQECLYYVADEGGATVCVTYNTIGYTQTVTYPDPDRVHRYEIIKNSPPPVVNIRFN